MKAKEETKTEKIHPVGDGVSESQMYFDLRTKRGQLLLFAITILISVLVQMLPSNIIRDGLKTICGTSTPLECKQSADLKPRNELITNKPKYWAYGRSADESHLRHVFAVLERLGIERVSNETTDWDLLWAHDYPFRLLAPRLHNLKSYQKVNHFPGCGFLTNKVDLCTTDLKYIPKAFKLPGDIEKFKEYAASKPSALFVQKHNQHRHIHIRSTSQIDFTNNDSFIQEFVDNPLLVDGHKFDIGVYTIITSVDPLRVYIYNGDVLFRYCAVKYHPFDASNVEKYIVGDDYLPTWELPSLAHLYNGLGYGMRDSFNAYIKKRGRDPSIIWIQVEDAIREAIQSKEPLIVSSLKRFPSKRNFFEMMRFDLVIDDDLKVTLMEANMSPNLSSAHFQPNMLLYEQVIFNLLNLVGVGSYLDRDSLRKRLPATERMISTDKNIMVSPVQCSESPCTESCAAAECMLCRPCLLSDDLFDIHEAYREHMFRGDNKRIYPAPVKQGGQLNQEKLNQLSHKNQLITRWFFEKCQMDALWCS